MYQHVVTRVHRRELWRRVALASGGEGFSTASDGFEDADVVIEVDVEKLFARLAGRAMHNRNNQASLGAGAVRARVLNRRRVL